MTTDVTELSRRGRAAYWVVAALAWAGVAATLIITAFDGYAAPTYVEEGLFAGAAHGWAGAPERLINCLSYFTELSNIVVAVIATRLARGSGPVGRWTRAIHLCATMMITVTAIVYAALIAPSEALRGIAVITNPLQHVVVPAAMVAAAFVFGPRGGITWSTVVRALAIPVAWVAYTMARGALVHQYPYAFLNVTRIGYGQALAVIGAILAGAMAFLGFFAAVDWGSAGPPERAPSTASPRGLTGGHGPGAPSRCGVSGPSCARPGRSPGRYTGTRRARTRVVDIVRGLPTQRGGYNARSCQQLASVRTTRAGANNARRRRRRCPRQWEFRTQFAMR